MVEMSLARSRLLAVSLITGGGAIALYSGFDLGAAFSELAHRGLIVALDAIDATGFLAGVGVILIGIVALLPIGASEPVRRGSRALPKIPAAAKPLMITAAIFIVASPVAASVVRTILASKAEGSGYIRCPRTTWPRKQPDRWALKTSAGVVACTKGEHAL